MAANQVNALVTKLQNDANLNLNAEQQQQFSQLVNAAAPKVQSRRDAAKQVLEQLQAAVENNQSAQTEELLQKLREGLRQAGQGREQFLDKLDQVLQPEQRARLVVHLAQQAHQQGKTLLELVDALLAQSSQ